MLKLYIGVIKSLYVCETCGDLLISLIWNLDYALNSFRQLFSAFVNINYGISTYILLHIKCLHKTSIKITKDYIDYACVYFITQWKRHKYTNFQK